MYVKILLAFKISKLSINFVANLMIVAYFSRYMASGNLDY